ncbi:predicted protein [Histoplasma mississippiense (nom. inval.)]|uniref:predicted protein n=1 Tax=Ajellomyces capsulatus (strain NAm1 / WU24) TaxID=2059318 RepID=UPI000157BDF4|nr:predicted protein [Histoplasma mississippiense (nom. inval.)]EDN06074.1 predicted protein [Histoplasma mississippiense (nom. inval.)]
MDESLPSRILPYMYLGNLTHANNPELLRNLGIRRILSIGESVSWRPSETGKWDPENLMMINEVQDNGIDPLTQQFDRCLQFIGWYCNVGALPRWGFEICYDLYCASDGFCFVRARRLNVIIQPHLRFVYELLKWDELLQQKRHEPIRRDLEWATIAREIALMNKPYSK